ncbi:exosortase C-terminal domain/associated protein EpsI [uncultured Croceicoccus sp.]|uniref:exosortase C-terminal domain/associated protein EpsI n=1 Tax=uncultured Croceicoccus sp. TaxID=1295329 RepID=UPI002609F397|nr:exosortase C-terminal domain/associated protein EpsI [uncultured Croceicoccus sp.]
MNRAGNHASRRDVLVGSVGLLCAGASVLATGEKDVDALPRGALKNAFPHVLGEWRAVPAGNVVLPPQSKLSDQLYNDVMVRGYENGDAMVVLLLAYGAVQNKSMQMHRPEGCYPASGFGILSSQVVQLPLADGHDINAKFLVTESNVRKEQVLYWSRVGNHFPTSLLSQRWAVLQESLAGRSPDGILVRTSTIANRPQAALPLLRSFADAMIAHAPTTARRLLTGRT